MYCGLCGGLNLLVYKTKIMEMIFELNFSQIEHDVEVCFMTGKVATEAVIIMRRLRMKKRLF